MKLKEMAVAKKLLIIELEVASGPCIVRSGYGLCLAHSPSQNWNVPYPMHGTTAQGLACHARTVPWPDRAGSFFLY